LEFGNLFQILTSCFWWARDRGNSPLITKCNIPVVGSFWKKHKNQMSRAILYLLFVMNINKSNKGAKVCWCQEKRTIFVWGSRFWSLPFHFQIL
jgi:hypothetical protein